MTLELEPLLKWSGSKRLVANAIQSLFPIEFSSYFEPFIGGGSVFLNVKGRSNRKEWVGDLNSWLTDTYLALRDSYDRVIKILESLTPCRSVYYRIREIHPSGLDLEYRAAHLIYLNQLCFGNIFRLNRHGYFNVPFYGSGVNKVYDPDHLYQIHQRLQGVQIHTGDFSEFTSQAQSGDFVYLDPPGNGGSFFGAHGSSNDSSNFYGFKDHDYYRMAMLCLDLDRRGVFWAISDENTSLMRILFSQFHRTTLSIDPSDQEIRSILFTNYVVTGKYEKERSTISEVVS